jgi:hypothetical protein
MSSAERTLFINTYKAISTPGHPEYSQYQTLIARHTTSFNTIHTSQYFLPWHRWFSHQLENLLQNVDCRVTLPWWDTAKNAGAPWNVSPWGAASDLMGTSMACVTNGGFASPGWPNNAHGCLSRSFSGTLPTSVQQANVLAMPPGNYVAFTDALETQIHNTVHVRVGGTMMNQWSPEAPEFFLHHNNIDQIWDKWQKQSNAHLNAYSFALNTAMPVAYGATPANYNDLKKTGVMYVRSSASSAGAGHFILLPCNLIVIGNLKFEMAVVQSSLAKASQSQLLQIPQLAAPVLTDAEQEKFATMMTRGMTPQNAQAWTARARQGRETLQKFNAALNKTGTLRPRFENSVDQALGFDIAKAAELLKIPQAEGSTTQGTIGTGQAVGTIKPVQITQTTACTTGNVYCATQKRCIPRGQRCG